IFDLLRWCTLSVVLAASLYSFVLCGAFTLGAPLTNGAIAAADAAIVVAALALFAQRVSPGFLLLILAIVVNFLAIGLFAHAFAAKAMRDVLVIVAFLGLGLRFGDARIALSAFFCISLCVVVFALFEFIAPRLFVHSFDVLEFYRMRGAVDAEQ